VGIAGVEEVGVEAEAGEVVGAVGVVGVEAGVGVIAVVTLTGIIRTILVTTVVTVTDTTTILRALIHTITEPTHTTMVTQHLHPPSIS